MWFKMKTEGIDKWYFRMKEHQRKGHHIIRFPGIGVKQDLIAKDAPLKCQTAVLPEKRAGISDSKGPISPGCEV